MRRSARFARRDVLALVRLALLFAGLSASAARAQPLAWSTRAPMPTPVSRAGHAVVDRTFVVLGGTTNGVGPSGEATDVVQAYDADRDQWRYLTPLPEARFAAASAALGGTVYLA